MRPSVENSGGHRAALQKNNLLIVTKFITRISFFFIVLAAILIFLVICMVTWMVFARTVGIPSHGLLELSVEIMVMSVFFAAPYTLYKNGHVKLDIITTALPSRLSKCVELSTDLLGLFVCIYLSWLGFQLAADAFISGERGLGALRQYVWPKYGAMGLGMGLTAVQYCSYITDRLCKNSK